MDQIRLGHDLSQQAQPGHNRGHTVRLRRNIEIFDFQQIAGLRTFHINRASHGVYPASLQRLQGGNRVACLDLSIEGIESFHEELLPGCDLDYRQDLRMKTVVAHMRLGGQRLTAIDADLLHHTLQGWFRARTDSND